MSQPVANISGQKPLWDWIYMIYIDFFYHEVREEKRRKDIIQFFLKLRDSSHSTEFILSVAEWAQGRLIFVVQIST
jgi:hypothetical protein